MEGKLLTTEEVAVIIRRAPFTVRRYLRDGIIPAIKLESGTWLVRESDVMAYLGKRTYKSEEK